MEDDKRWTEEESAMWENTHESFEKMPEKMKIKFCEAIAAILEDEPEEDKLARKIQEAMRTLKSSWGEFPEKWNKTDFQKLCAKAKSIWLMLDHYGRILEDYKIERLRSQAKEIFERVPFDRIELEGRMFNLKKSDEPELCLPEDDIPF